MQHGGQLVTSLGGCTCNDDGSDSGPLLSQAASQGNNGASAPPVFRASPPADYSSHARPDDAEQQTGDAGSGGGSGSNAMELRANSGSHGSGSSSKCHGDDSGEGYGLNPNGNGSSDQLTVNNGDSYGSDHGPAESRSQGNGSSKTPCSGVTTAIPVLCAGKAHALAHAQANPHAGSQHLAALKDHTAATATAGQSANGKSPDIKALVLSMLAAELPSAEAHQHNKALQQQLLVAQLRTQQQQRARPEIQHLSAFEPFAQQAPSSAQDFDSCKNGSSLAFSRACSVQRPKASRGSLQIAQLPAIRSASSAGASNSSGVRIGSIQGGSSCGIGLVSGSGTSSSLGSELTGMGGFQPYHSHALKRRAVNEDTGPLLKRRAP